MPRAGTAAIGLIVTTTRLKLALAYTPSLRKIRYADPSRRPALPLFHSELSKLGLLRCLSLQREFLVAGGLPRLPHDQFANRTGILPFDSRSRLFASVVFRSRQGAVRRAPFSCGRLSTCSCELTWPMAEDAG
jgi:hypothetical protein